MYNPFPLLTPALLKDRIMDGKRYFVRQVYKRGMKSNLKAAFLIRAYDASEKELADQHMRVLSKDPNAFLYDANDPAHLEKLNIAANQPVGFKIFYAGKTGVDWKPPLDYDHKIRHYILKKHPTWRTKPGGDKIEIGLYEEFGELFLKFGYQGEEDRILFEEIEKY
jgi:hypothetical protein